MKPHFICIDNLPDDVNENNMPDTLEVSVRESCNYFTYAMLLTTLIRRLAANHPEVLELHQFMLENDFFLEVSIND